MKNPFEKNIKNLKTENLIVSASSAIKIYKDSISTDKQGGTTGLPTIEGNTTLFVSGNIQNFGTIKCTETAEFDKGLVISLTTTQRDAIVSPKNGTLLFNTTENELQIWNGVSWDTVGSGGPAPYNLRGARVDNTNSWWTEFVTGTLPANNSQEYSVGGIFHFVQRDADTNSNFPATWQRLTPTVDRYGTYIHARSAGNVITAVYMRGDNNNPNNFSQISDFNPPNNSTYAWGISSVSGTLLFSVNGFSDAGRFNEKWGAGVPEKLRLGSFGSLGNNIGVVVSYWALSGSALSKTQLDDWTGQFVGQELNANYWPTQAQIGHTFDNKSEIPTSTYTTDLGSRSMAVNTNGATLTTFFPNFIAPPS
jgi:hypothetical protein